MTIKTFRVWPGAIQAFSALPACSIMAGTCHFQRKYIFTSELTIELTSLWISAHSCLRYIGMTHKFLIKKGVCVCRIQLLLLRPNTIQFLKELVFTILGKILPSVIGLGKHVLLEVCAYVDVFSWKWYTTACMSHSTKFFFKEESSTGRAKFCTTLFSWDGPYCPSHRTPWWHLL